MPEGRREAHSALMSSFTDACPSRSFLLPSWGGAGERRWVSRHLKLRAYHKQRYTVQCRLRKELVKLEAGSLELLLLRSRKLGVSAVCHAQQLERPYIRGVDHKSGGVRRVSKGLNATVGTTSSLHYAMPMN
ncbi:hypothetical protein TRAPUB_13619 [Trametes pubescens]|uniref:Uncharacterized protein n=1 Tax=Trametes pubescens TaxID=154538 RepID=A0A1M2VQM8_TRAPU|nr:hypothetical protein TRAPUB_13619 [Trametes pubescens]